MLLSKNKQAKKKHLVFSHAVYFLKKQLEFPCRLPLLISVDTVPSTENKAPIATVPRGIPRRAPLSVGSLSHPPPRWTGGSGWDTQAVLLSQAVMHLLSGAFCEQQE